MIETAFETMDVQERRRAMKAMPPFLPGNHRVAGVVGIALFALLFVVVFWVTPTHPLYLVIPSLVAALLLVHIAKIDKRERQALVEARVRGLHALVVHSDSSQWREHIEQRWFPRLRPNVARLDWSGRSKWKDSVETRVFKAFVGDRNSNPVVVVFRGMNAPMVFRFYEAFRQARAGHPQYLEGLEAEMFRTFNLESAAE